MIVLCVALLHVSNVKVSFPFLNIHDMNTNHLIQEKTFVLHPVKTSSSEQIDSTTYIGCHAMNKVP